MGWLWAAHWAALLAGQLPKGAELQGPCAALDAAPHITNLQDDTRLVSECRPRP